MHRFSLAALFAVVAVLGIALESQASGGLFRRCGGRGIQTWSAFYRQSPYRQGRSS